MGRGGPITSRFIVGNLILISESQNYLAGNLTSDAPNLLINHVSSMGDKEWEKVYLYTETDRQTDRKLILILS